MFKFVRYSLVSVFMVQAGAALADDPPENLFPQSVEIYRHPGSRLSYGVENPDEIYPGCPNRLEFVQIARIDSTNNKEGLPAIISPTYIFRTRADAGTLDVVTVPNIWVAVFHLPPCAPDFAPGVRMIGFNRHEIGEYIGTLQGTDDENTDVRFDPPLLRTIFDELNNRPCSRQERDWVDQTGGYYINSEAFCPVQG